MKTKFYALLALVGAAAQTADAVPLVWSTPDNMVVEAPIYLGGAQVSLFGEFTFDASTNDLSSWSFFEGERGSVSATPITFLETVDVRFFNGTLAGFEFGPIQPDSCAATGVGCIYQQLLLGFLGLSAPTDAGGTLTVNVGYDSSTFSGSGFSTVSASAAAPVPLPGTLGLLGLGAVALGALRRRA